tara:strand:+ start:3052 stop:3807 length:756 start_codon:yes stop_codon:yes gene_type:complete
MWVNLIVWLFVPFLSSAQNPQLSEWALGIETKNYKWLQATNFYKSTLIGYSRDTLSGNLDSCIYQTIELDTSAKMLIKVYYYNAKKNAPARKKFNEYYLFDSLGFPYHVDKKLRPYAENYYEFSTSGLLIKRNSWNYIYDSTDSFIIKAGSESVHCCFPFSRIEYFYPSDTLIKEFRINYNMKKHPISKETMTYNLKNGIAYGKVVDLYTAKVDKVRIELKDDAIIKYTYTSTNKLCHIWKLEIEKFVRDQ